MRVTKSLKIDENVIDELEKYCKRNNVKQCDIVENGILLEIKRLTESKPKVSPEKGVENDQNQAFLALIKQLEIKDAQITEKDEQISRKDKQIDDLTESLRAAQALHAADKGLGKLSGGEDAEPLLVPDQEQSKPKWWQFWK